MKLAVIISGSDYHNFVGINKIAVTRAELLKKNYDYEVDYFYLECKYEYLSFRNIFKELELYSTVAYDKHIYVLQKKQFVSDNKCLKLLLKIYYKIFKRKISDWEWQESLGKFIKGYDLITAHFNDAALIAFGAKQRYGTPYCVTWHGSDIHTIPFNDSAAKVKTIEAIENADHNFFVSNTLLEKSNELTTKGLKGVIYNSVDDDFIQFSDDVRISLRNEYNVAGCKVVTFIGHLIDIKNALLLPDIFKRTCDNYSEKIVFWIIGEGNRRKEIEEKLKKYQLEYRIWGFVNPKKIPNILNCTDVFVLPSKNEGLPLVTIEALRCGANVVGSRVGGIPEVIGKNYCISLDNEFINDFADKLICVLNNRTKQNCSEKFSWYSIVEYEHNIYSNILIR